MRFILGLISFSHVPAPFPPPYLLDSGSGLWDTLWTNFISEPFNGFAAIVFFLAIFHSFMAKRILHASENAFTAFEIKKKKLDLDKDARSIKGKLLHFLGEVEAIFGIWILVLGVGSLIFGKWEAFSFYINNKNYTEPLFVVVIMTIASSRPILKLFELILWKMVRLVKWRLEAWWIILLTLAPLAGSFITEPAAMTITAYLLLEKFYILRPSLKFQYATLGLLFVNISIGGALTNFASPPILIVAEAFNWSSLYVFVHIGIRAAFATFLSTFIYFILFRKELHQLRESYSLHAYEKYIQRRFIRKKDLEIAFDALEYEINRNLGFTKTFVDQCDHIKSEISERASAHLTEKEKAHIDVNAAINKRFEDLKIDEMKRTIPGLLPERLKPFYRDPNWDHREDKVPYWLMGIHVFFLIWTIINAHSPVLFMGGFMFYLGVFQVTAYYQNRLDLKPPLMVAFFLSGLLIHGGLQAWWIAPILSQLGTLSLGVSALILTAFNDNAAITYLVSLVPNLSEASKYAVTVGAITGGGLTLIANAPNPVGQSILKPIFPKGIHAGHLFLGALLPTIVTGIIFLL